MSIRISKQALDKFKQTPHYARDLAVCLNVSEVTARKYIKHNDIILTTAQAVSLIRKAIGHISDRDLYARG